MLIYNNDNYKVFNTDHISMIDLEYNEEVHKKTGSDVWDVVVYDVKGNKHLVKRFWQKEPCAVMYNFKCAIHDGEKSFKFG